MQATAKPYSPLSSPLRKRSHHKSSRRGGPTSRSPLTEPLSSSSPNPAASEVDYPDRTTDTPPNKPPAAPGDESELERTSTANCLSCALPTCTCPKGPTSKISQVVTVLNDCTTKAFPNPTEAPREIAQTVPTKGSKLTADAVAYRTSFCVGTRSVKRTLGSSLSPAIKLEASGMLESFVKEAHRMSLFCVEGSAALQEDKFAYSSFRDLSRVLASLFRTYHAHLAG